MPEFTSFKNLANYYSVNTGALLKSQPEILNIVKKEIMTLEMLLKEELQKYFNSYNPTVYERTGATMDSITVNEPYVEGDFICAEITFEEVQAYHPSVIGEDQEFGYTPWLLELGWDIEDKVSPPRMMFTQHPGTMYIATAVSRYNRQNKYGIKVSVYRGDEQYI